MTEFPPYPEGSYQDPPVDHLLRFTLSLEGGGGDFQVDKKGTPGRGSSVFRGMELRNSVARGDNCRHLRVDLGNQVQIHPESQ